MYVRRLPYDRFGYRYNGQFSVAQGALPQSTPQHIVVHGHGRTGPARAEPGPTAAGGGVYNVLLHVDTSIILGFIAQ